MLLKTPKFWQKKNSVLSYFLIPFSWDYRTISYLRRRFIKPQKVSVPVICVGNITVGGSGKTPVAIEIAKMISPPPLAPTLKGEGEEEPSPQPSPLEGEGAKRVHFLTRGYGGKIKTPTLVDLEKHTAEDVGDEPLLLAKVAPTWVSRNRVAGAEEAIKNGAEIIIMDDGLQNPTIHKDFKILVIDSEYGLGNGRIFPAGPLREKTAKVDIVIQIGDAKPIFPDIPTINAKIIPEQTDIKTAVAFAGIGRPEKFFKSLEEIGVEVVEKLEFPDHHFYTEKDIEELKQTAEKHNAELITTEKDLVKIPEKQGIKVLPIKIQFEDDKIISNLKNYIENINN